jgi:hypothetical protein
MFNNFISNINNKTLLSNIILYEDNTVLTIDTMYTKPDIEINIIIKIIIPHIKHHFITTNNYWIPSSSLGDNIIPIITGTFTSMIKLCKPNPMFKLCKIDTIADYDKKIKSFKMPLYNQQRNTNYDIIFDLYPTQSSLYILITSEIINNNKLNSYKFYLDKDCTKCINRIKGCELNMISKVQLCCDCNTQLIRKDLDKFIGKNNDYHLYIKIKDFPSYIKDNFSTFPIISFNI